MGGRYRLDAAIGEGSMGLVYRGAELKTNRPVAVKVLKAQYAGNEEHAERFLREARAVAVVRNPHVVEILDLGRERDGELWFVMELLEGRTLLEVLKAEGRQAPEEAVRIGRQICSALSVIHSHGIVHRDLKLANVLLVTRGNDPRFVKVFDFGVAKGGGDSDEHQLTQAGMLVGTLDCMAPEQIRGQQPDARTDIYALGTLLYRLLSGTPVFAGNSAVAILGHHLDSAPEPLTKRVPDAKVPSALNNVVLRCLAKAPKDRFASVSDLDDALEESLQGTATGMKLDQPLALEAAAAPKAPPRPAGPVAARPAAAPAPKEAPSRPVARPAARTPSNPAIRQPAAQPAARTPARPAAQPTPPDGTPVRPAARPAGPPVAAPTGPPVAAPTGPPVAAPTGPPVARPTGPPAQRPVSAAERFAADDKTPPIPRPVPPGPEPQPAAAALPRESGSGPNRLPAGRQQRAPAQPEPPRPPPPPPPVDDLPDDFLEDLIPGEADAGSSTEAALPFADDPGEAEAALEAQPAPAGARASSLLAVAAGVLIGVVLAVGVVALIAALIL